MTQQEQLDAFIKRAGFSYGWQNLESWARRMAEQAVAEATKEHNAEAALENCRLLAARHRHEDWARGILRFCTEGGATGSPLRGEQS
jgi:hypothetical protein